MGDQKTLAQRLDSQQYDRQDVLNALRGERLPEHLGYPLIKLCTISGILHSPTFAEGEAAPLRRVPEHPEFTRALNARAIMSNQMPDVDPAAHPEELPYCIWYPEVASEDTYRQLATRHPQMRYQVARACAVAGYTGLYLELVDHVLPEVGVAEEARDAGSDAIFNHIMSQPVRYKVMEDYFRTINLESPQPACLNGDTCVFSMLQRQKQKFRAPYDPDDDYSMMVDDDGFKEMMYSITEDQGIAESVPDNTSSSSSPPADDPMLHLLTSPLPADLPAGNKDTLILAAAFHGDIDRYTRLRRPKVLENEFFCVIRGIYHNSLFALWWSRQPNAPKNEPFHMQFWGHVQKAITARHIMNNDLSRILLPHAAKRDGGADYDKETPLPYLIWYPNIADAETYRALAHRVPKMREACVRAAIYAGYSELFDELLLLPGVVPNRYLKAEAEKASNAQDYISCLQSRAGELGVKISESHSDEVWKLVSVRGISFLRRSNSLVGSPRAARRVSGQFFEQGTVYNGIMAEMDGLELFLMAPEAWRAPEGEYLVELDYKKWPSSSSLSRHGNVQEAPLGE